MDNENLVVDDRAERQASKSLGDNFVQRLVVHLLDLLRKIVSAI